MEVIPMKNRRLIRTDEGRRGQAVVEFGIAVPVLLLMSITGFSIGMMFDRYITVIQFNRNAGNMFARGVDFNNQSNLDTLMMAASGLNIKSDGTGQGVLYLALVEKVPMAQGYVNEGQVVYMRFMDIGNTSVSPTKLGNVPPVDSLGVVTVDSFNDPLAVVQSFPAALEAVMRDGDQLFVSEMLYDPIELGFSAYLGIEMIHSRAYF